MGSWSTPFPGEKVDYHLRIFGHLPEVECGEDVRVCEHPNLDKMRGFSTTHQDKLPIQKADGYQKKSVKPLRPKASRRGIILKRRKTNRQARRLARR